MSLASLQLHRQLSTKPCHQLSPIDRLGRHQTLRKGPQTADPPTRGPDPAGQPLGNSSDEEVTVGCWGDATD